MKKRSGLLRRFTKNIAVLSGIIMTARAINDFIHRIESKDKIVLITGGSRGLGLILARQLATEGARVVICGRSEESLHNAAADLSFITTDFLAIPCDITDKEQVRSMIRHVSERMGSIDILINNAGIVQIGPMESMKEKDYEEAIRVHFWGPFHVINEVLPEMKKKKEGRIVNIVSIGGKLSFPHLLPYNTGKYALSGFSEGLTAELKKYNIRVTTVNPGLMRTGSPRNIDVKGRHEAEYAWFKIFDSLPVLSMDADRAAEKIIEAMKTGERTLTLTLPAKLGEAAHGFAPGLTITLFEWIRAMMPEKGEDGEEVKKGYQSESRVSESFMTRETDEAADRNLER